MQVGFARLAGLALALVTGGCGNDLPSASFIDKLRVLAIKAEPPEVAPGQPTVLTALVVEPDVSPLGDTTPPTRSYQWLACAIPPGATTQLPCLPPKDTVPPSCDVGPGAPLCFIASSKGDTATYTPDRSLLGAKGTAQILLTLVVADEGTALSCGEEAFTDGVQKSPDHCVIALKRLTVSDPARVVAGADTVPAPNQNPALDDFFFTDEAGTRTALLDGNGMFTISPDKNAKSVTLQARRAESASEEEPTFDDNGKLTGYAYEGLTVAWFTSAGKISGGRSAFDPPGCDAQAACPAEQPGLEVDTDWTPPTADELARTALPDGTVNLWAILRDDRGGVSWVAGRARPR